MVIKAENDKQSAIDFANATETKADGDRRAQIKEAEGIKQSLILEAEGKSQAIERVAEARAKEIQLVNEAAEKYFIGNAKELKKLEVTQSSLENNSKIVLTEKGISPTLVLNETGETIIPTNTKKDESK
jgi:regulator of protease activity HflC (stomatin/prohibitin superfamily)